jgi:hypothetical protein
MARKKLSRNAPCPCNSGKKYKDCCWDKGFEWVEDENGTVYKSTPMSPAVKQALEQLREAFIAKHGREPGPDDLVFPDLPHPEHLEHMMVEDMKAAGMDPAFIYAFEQTGLLVTEQNMHLISDEDLADWNAAIEEYEAKRRKKKRRPKYPLGIVALYGPDDQTTTKVTAAVIEAKDSQPVMKRWVSTGVMENPKVERQLREFFTRHGVESVTMSEGNMGCPHEEGLDYPRGEDCPFCPFWKGKQGSGARE